VAARLLSLGEAVEGRAVDQEDVEPSVAVVVDPRDAGARRLEQVLVLLAAAEDRNGLQARFGAHLLEREAQRRFRLSRRGERRDESRGSGYEREQGRWPAEGHRPACASVMCGARR